MLEDGVSSRTSVELLGSVMFWKLFSLLCMEFPLARRILAVLCPALLQPQPLPDLCWCFPGELQSFVCWCFPGELQSVVLDEQQFLTLGMGAWRISLDPSLSCHAGSHISASCFTPRRVDALEAWEWTWPIQQLHPAQSGSSSFSREPSRVAAVPLPLLSPPWCCCCFSAPSQGMEGLLALTIPAGAAKISDLVQEEPVPPSMGSPWAFPCPANPRELLERAGMGWPCSWPILLCVLWCWISKGWKTAGHPAPPALGSQD